MPISDFPMGRYCAFLLALSVSYRLPMLLLPETEFASQLVNVVILYLVLALQPLLKLRLWVSILAGVPIMAAMLVGHSHLAYETLGLGGAEYDKLWASLAILYLFTAGIALQYFMWWRHKAESTV